MLPGLPGMTFKLYNVNPFEPESLSLFSDISYRINCLQVGQPTMELGKEL